MAAEKLLDLCSIETETHVKPMGTPRPPLIRATGEREAS